LSGDACIVNPNPQGLTCADPIPLQLGHQVIQGTTVGAQNNTSGHCGGQGRERVYAITLTEKAKLTAVADGFDAVLYLRQVCGDPSTELACNDDARSVKQLSSITAQIQAGSYFLFVDSYSDPGSYTLTVDIQSDPCAGDPCPGLPECAPSTDWSSYECVCGAGTVAYEDTCVVDPCTPNPCLDAVEFQTRCEAQLPSSYTCACAVGYIEDPENGGCMMDPDANEWAFFVFLNGDNNLESDAWDDLAEMETAGSTPFVHIVVLLDTYSGSANKLYVTQDGHETVESMGEIDMSDWRELGDFGAWAVQNYPARHVALIMWDHGAGWEKRGAPAHPLLKGFSNDDHGQADEISVSNGDYARALAQITAARGSKLDIVGFDACLMGMWEVAEASAPYADVLVASQETEPASGWAYHNFLPGLIANPQSISPQDLGRSIVDAYYNESSDNSTLAVIDLTTMDALATSMTTFANALMTISDQYSRINTLRTNAQNFYYFDEFRDIKHFAQLVGADSQIPGRVASTAQGLVTQLGNTILYSRAHSSHPDATGLSVFFPGTNDWNSNYIGSGAVWSVRTTWDDFLLDFTGGK
jgi:hypothetical protein